MFLEPGSNHGEPPICMSCKLPIISGEKAVALSFDADDEHGLSKMNGVYHAECAAPLTTVIRALGVLRYRPL